MKYSEDQIKDILENAPSGSQFYTDGYDVKYRKVIGDKYFGYLDEAKGWVETCDKQLSQERIDKGWWLPNLLKELENQMNIDKVETQTEHQEEMSALISANRMNESVDELLDGLKGENEWNGEGLPPVGSKVMCSYTDTDCDGWCDIHGPSDIIAYHGDYVWIAHHGKFNRVHELCNVEFQKPESPEDKEERERLENGKSLHTAASKTEEAIAHGVFRLWEMEDKTTRNHYCQLAEIIGHKTNYRKGVK